MDHLRISMNKNIYVFTKEEAFLIRNSLYNCIKKNEKWFIINTKDFGMLFLNINLIESIEFKQI